MKKIKTMLLGIAIICFGNSLSLLNMFGTNGECDVVGMIMSAVGAIVVLVSFFRKGD